MDSHRVTLILLGHGRGAIRRCCRLPARHRVLHWRARDMRTCHTQGAYHVGMPPIRENAVSHPPHCLRNRQLAHHHGPVVPPARVGTLLPRPEAARRDRHDPRPHRCPVHAVPVRPGHPRRPGDLHPLVQRGHRRHQHPRGQPQPAHRAGRGRQSQDHRGLRPAGGDRIAHPAATRPGTRLGPGLHLRGPTGLGPGGRDLERPDLRRGL
jgi:hypothetical protein